MHKLLMVEDNRNVREFCRRELENEGYRVILAASGKDALATLCWWTPALVILDGRMPGRNGLELLAEMRQLYPDLPVILYTEHAQYATDPRAHKARAVVAKTEDLSELKRTIAAVLGRRATESLCYLTSSRN